MHSQNGDSQSECLADYLKKIKQALAYKRMRIFKQALALGQRNAEKACQGFVDNFNNLDLTIRNAKIDCIIKHAENLIKIHIEKNPRILVSMVLKLLNNIAEHTDVELCANKDDVAAIKSSVNEIVMACAYARKINIIEDDSLPRGSMVIKANKSIIDAQLKTQLYSARQILLNNLPSS